MELGNVSVKFQTWWWSTLQKKLPKQGAMHKTKKNIDIKIKEKKLSFPTKITWRRFRSQLKTSFAELFCLFHKGLGLTKLQGNGAGCSSAEQPKN